jgi:hypothetical protein
MTRTERINLVASGEPLPSTEIYWDESDPNNIGPAYRDGVDSGSLEFEEWDGPTDGTEDVWDTYSLAAYFTQNNAYSGPDQHGVYPTFSL